MNLSRISKPKASYNGFSLVELMIALVIGSIVLAAVIVIFASNKRAYRQTDQYVQLQENGRYALSLLANEIRNVGYFGTLRAADITPAVNPPAGDCSNPLNGVNVAAAFRLDSPLWGGTVAAAPAYGCIPNAAAGSDVVAIKRVVGNPTRDAALNTGAIYLRTENRILGTLFNGGMAPLPSGDADLNWEYLSDIYYIADTTTPQLARMRLRYRGGAATWEREALVEGIEDIRVLYAVTDSKGSYLADAAAISASANADAVWRNVSAVRIYLLVRSGEDPFNADPKTYTLGDRVITPRDNFRRKVFTTTVVLKNPQILAVGGL
jgi:type IV pilus assembly protein PilW